MSLFLSFAHELLQSPNRSPGFYDPEHRSPKTNAVVVAVFCFLMGGAFWYSLMQPLET